MLAISQATHITLDRLGVLLPALSNKPLRCDRRLRLCVLPLSPKAVGGVLASGLGMLAERLRDQLHRAGDRALVVP
jgi:hypothetical protein